MNITQNFGEILRKIYIFFYARKIVIYFTQKNAKNLFKFVIFSKLIYAEILGKLVNLCQNFT